MKPKLISAASEKIIIAAHRGACGGNIPCNIIPAYEAALLQGADMIEIDVDMTSDGKLVIFHPGMEKSHLGIEERVCNMPWERVLSLRYVNYDRVPTQFGLNTLDQVLECFKDRCYINVDKFWAHPLEIYKAIKRHAAEEQVLVKSSPTKEVISLMSSVCPELPFMAIVENEHPMHDMLMKSGINYVGAEVLFSNESCQVASPEFISRMHRDGRLVWVNSIIYNHKTRLSAAHSDDSAICGDPDFGWGWLAEQGFDIIQTDWTQMLKDYLEKKGMLYKK